MRADERPVTAAEDWDRHWLVYAASNRLNPAQDYRRQIIFRALDLPRSPRPVRVLELGSGYGELANHALRLCPDTEFLGLDRSQTAVEASRGRVPGAQFIQCDLTRSLDLPSSYTRWATHAVCSEVLEHIDEPQLVLANARPYLAPGCRMVITVPGGPRSAFDRHIGHRRHFSRAALGDLIATTGLSVVWLGGAGFPFFNLYRLAVVLRGQALIDQGRAGDSGQLSLGTRAAMRAFSWLFRLNTTKTRLGWQLIALAEEPTTRATQP